MRLSKIRGALSSLADAVRTDQRTLHGFHSKYGGRWNDSTPLARDLAQNVGLQLLAGVRLMRFFNEIEAPLASRITSRMIRHLYGSDIHWDAEFAPGVMVVHGMGMAISHAAKIDEDVLLFQNCTLGEGRDPDTKEVGAPHVEAGAVIGAGCTIIGPVTIGAKSKVMPGCVITRSVPPGSIVESPTAVVKARKPGAGAAESHEAQARRTR